MKTLMIYFTIFIDMILIGYFANRSDKEVYFDIKLGFILIALIFVFNIIAILL